MTPNPLSIDDLIDRVQTHTCHIDQFYPHYKAGTVGIFYQQAITSVIEDLMMIPIRRLDKGLPVIEESEVIADSLSTIAELIANVVGKTATAVEHDMLQMVEEFPADDIRQSTHLRHQNRLN